MSQCHVCGATVDLVVRGPGYCSYNCASCLKSYRVEFDKNFRPWRQITKAKGINDSFDKYVVIDDSANKISHVAIEKTPPEKLEQEVNPPQTREELLKQLLMRLLVESGRQDIAEALQERLVDTLNHEQKDALTTYALRARAEFAGGQQDISNSLVQVSTSGWGREPEVTTPGVIQPLMAL